MKCFEGHWFRRLADLEQIICGWVMKFWLEPRSSTTIPADSWIDTRQA